MKILVPIFLVSLNTNTATTATLHYINSDASYIKKESVMSVLVHGDESTSVSMHTKNMGCLIRTKSIEEAYKIQDSIVNDKNSWIACHGEITRPNGPNSVYIETAAYTLGKAAKEIK